MTILTILTPFSVDYVLFTDVDSSRELKVNKIFCVTDPPDLCPSRTQVVTLQLTAHQDY